MPRWFRILMIVITVGMLALTGICALGYRLVTRSLPMTQGTLAFGSLGDSVVIGRDSYHIPHIQSGSEEALFFGQGFATAQDRLWQMDVWRRMATGRLSEMFGKLTLETDSLIRILGIPRNSARFLPQCSEETRRLLQAYADGVNAYLEAFGNKPPLEYNLLGLSPEPWEPLDSYSIIRWLCWEMSAGWEVDPLLGAAVERVGWPMASMLFPPGTERPSRMPSGFLDHRNLAHHSSMISGSNAWAVSGSRTESGLPLMAADPHMTVTHPPFWYQVHLSSQDFNAAGLSIPGLPGILMGRNDDIAWVFTSLMADDLDLIVDESGLSYAKIAGNEESGPDLKIHQEQIRIRGGESVTLTSFETAHGPVVSEILNPRQDRIVSMSWTGNAFSDEPLAYSRILKSRNWEDFRKALRSYAISPQVFLYADRKGNIGSQTAGRMRPAEVTRWVPVFASEYPQNPPSIPFENLPHVYNPAGGWLASANHPPSGNPGFEGLWTTSRSDRIAEILSEDRILNSQAMQEMQADVKSIFGLEVMRLCLSDLAVDLLKPEEKFLADRLTEWEGQMRSGSMEAALFEVFWHHLKQNTFKDELGDSLFKSLSSLEIILDQGMKRILPDPLNAWFDDGTTEPREGRKEIVNRSFRDAAVYLTKEIGNDPSRWTWGYLHELTFPHLLGRHPLLERSFNLGPFPQGGSAHTLNCTGFDASKPYAVVWNPSGRVILDLSDPNKTKAVLPTGQSGQPLDPHYRDQLPLYLGNNTLNISMNPDAVSFEKRLILKPGGNP